MGELKNRIATGNMSEINIENVDCDRPLISTQYKESQRHVLDSLAWICGIGALVMCGMLYATAIYASYDGGDGATGIPRQKKLSLQDLESNTPFHKPLYEVQKERLHDYDYRIKIVKDILERIPLIDGHNDLPMVIRLAVDNEISKFNLLNNSATMTDIHRLRKGMVSGQFWSIYVDCESQYKDALQYAIEQIDLVKTMVRRNLEVFKIATSVRDITDAHNEGRIAALMGVEGGHMMGESLAVLRQLYDLGARYMTLTHNCNTPWADNNQPEADKQTPMNNGLTDWGKLVIAEMNRLGMLVDIAHVSPKVMADVLDVSRAPVISSHSTAYSVCPHPRNTPDFILKRLKETGGVIMVTFVPAFVNCTTDDTLNMNRSASLEQIADHFDHIKNVADAEIIGIGSDFDGIPNVPTGLEDVSKFPDLFSELLRRGWSIEELEGVAGKNLLRVFSQVEKVRDSLVDQYPIETPIDYSSIPNTQCRGSPVK